LADEVHRAWVGFATQGDPGWARHTLEHRAVRIFDVPSSTVDDPRADELAALRASRLG
jgi:para-nitrobenzyl esterase